MKGNQNGDPGRWLISGNQWSANMSSVNAIGFAATIAVGLPSVPCVADWRENGMGSMRYPTEAANDRAFRSAAEAPESAGERDDSEPE